MNSTIQEYSNIYLKKVLNFIELSQNIPIVCEFYLCMSDYISYNSDKSLGLNYALKAEKLLLAMTNEKKIDADEYLTLKTLTLYYKGFFQSEAGNYIEALSNIEDSLKKSVHLSNSKDLTDKISSILLSVKRNSEISQEGVDKNFDLTTKSKRTSLRHLELNAVSRELSVDILPKKDSYTSYSTRHFHERSSLSTNRKSFPNAKISDIYSSRLLSNTKNLRSLNYAFIKDKEIIISGNLHQVAYYISHDLKKLFIKITDKRLHVVECEWKMPEKIDTLQYINEKIEPFINIKDDNIFLDKESELFCQKMKKIIDKLEYCITIYKILPRENYKIKAIAYDLHKSKKKFFKNLSVDELKNYFPQEITIQLLSASIFIKAENIDCAPCKEMNLIYVNKHKFSDKSYILQFYHVIHNDFESIYIEPDKQSKLNSLCIDNKSLEKL